MINYKRILQLKWLVNIQYQSISFTKNESHYEVLQISKTATLDQIKKAYFDKAKKYHPDHNPNNKTAEDNFKKIVKAYEILKNPSSRQMYDLSLRNPNFDESATKDDYSQYYEDMQRPQDMNNRKYYENRWYNYRPFKERNLRDEFYGNSKFMQDQEVTYWKSIMYRAGIVVAIWLIFDLYRYYTEKKHKQFLQTQKEIFVQGFQEPKLQLSGNAEHIPLDVYIKQRQQELDKEEEEFDQLNQKQ